MASACAQQRVANEKIVRAGDGSVEGHLKDSETKSPLRFAEIVLIPRRNVTDLDEVENESKRFNPPKPYITKVLGHTGIDGDFRIDGVPVGDYLVGALMFGYVTPGLPTDANASTDNLEHLIASIPVVHVTSGQVARVDLVLRHGAVIAGRVHFADGSPMTGAPVEWELAEQNLAILAVRLAQPSPLQQALQDFNYYTTNRREVLTDSEGHYRISGLPPGRYIISTILGSQLTSVASIILSDGSSPDSNRQFAPYPELTTVYGPGVFRRSDAKIFEIRDGEQVMNADLKVDPSGLHRVRGRLFAGEDHHVPAQAMIRLREKGGRDVGKFVFVKEDGSFQFDYMPPGNYELELLGAHDQIGLHQTSLRYKMPKLDVVVDGHDVVLDDIFLTPLKPGETENDPR